MATGGITGKGFVKGDPRINRAGRPKDFNGMRELARKIASEKITSSDGRTAMSRIELILREMSISKDPRQRIAFLEIAYGKVPNPVEITGDINHTMDFNEIINGGDTD